MRLSRVLEVISWAVAFVCSGTCLTFWARAYVTRSTANRIEQISRTQTLARKEGISPPVSTGKTVSDVMGELEIPSIHLSVPILSNYDPDSLRRGVGHIPGTAFPGGLGNLALAGHRDTYFRPLRDLHIGARIFVSTSDGQFVYIVDSMKVVTPEQVSVLEIHQRPEMTLITCFPFQYVGSAPMRFIVQTHLLSVMPRRVTFVP